MATMRRLHATGMRFVPVDHAGYAQKAPAEAERLKQTFVACLGRTWIDQRGERRIIGLEDILVVSPYNMQVNHLRDMLPDGARVGTVDKFQGQEAAVVLISMTTSSGEDMPRNIEFLYSRNRLNVAISRARCLSSFLQARGYSKFRAIPSSRCSSSTRCVGRSIIPIS